MSRNNSRAPRRHNLLKLGANSDKGQIQGSVGVFRSWLGLCPDNRISGGKKLSVATRTTANRVAHALRVAVQGAGNAHNEIGDFHRRMRARLGGAAAVTATAHKLARILYACLRDKTIYEPTRHSLHHAKRRARLLNQLRRKAQNLGFQLVELQSPA